MRTRGAGRRCDMASEPIPLTPGAAAVRPRPGRRWRWVQVGWAPPCWTFPWMVRRRRVAVQTRSGLAGPTTPRP